MVSYVTLQKPLIVKLIDVLSEEDVIRVANEVSKDMFRDVMLLLRDEIELLLEFTKHSKTKNIARDEKRI
jgi:hypothetical protein